MPGNRLDGRLVAQTLQAEQRAQASELTVRLGRPVALGMVLVGEHAPSQIYVRHKQRAAAAIGMRSHVVQLPDDVSQATLLAHIARLNDDAGIDAFLVQLPLPAHLDGDTAVAAVAACKDADGLHPHNVAALWAGRPAAVPCTPAGCMRLLQHAHVPLAGAHAVVLGRSAIVGKPLALMLSAANATVTLCHSRTAHIARHVRCADIVVAAVGCAKFVRGSWVKRGAVVLDVGINREGPKLVGDVAYDEVIQRAAWITPVPGGVGPMTVAMLLQNTLDAVARRPL